MRRTIRVWDIVVRVLHWTLAVAFVIAFATGDEWLTPHVWAGYVAGAVVGARLVWGLIGTRHARFTDFVYAPRTVRTHFGQVLRFRSPRYLGHSPSGGAMIVALLAVTLVTVVTGLVTYGGAEQGGPLKAIVAPRLDTGSAESEEAGEGDRRHERGIEREHRESTLIEVHEVFANLLVVLVFIHIGGVLLASLTHRENLIRAMIDGMKREPSERDVRGLERDKRVR